MKKTEQSQSQIAICVPDNCGRLIGKWQPAERLAQALADGMPMPNFHLVTGLENVPFGAVPVTGIHTGFPNGRLFPDEDTRFQVPGEESTDYFIGDAYDAGATLVEEAPRSILKRQVARLEDAGLKATMASELEFHLFDQSYSVLAQTDYQDLQPYYHRHGDNDMFVAGKARVFLERLVHDLAGAGIVVDQIQGEGGSGQLEMNVKPSHPLCACDQHAVFKHIVKVRAALDTRSVTFMAKPFQDSAGSGGHVHMCLADLQGRTLLEEAKAPMGTAAAFIAGVLKYTADFMILHAPYANSYKRLQKGSFTPLNAGWAWDNRSCMVRLTGANSSSRMELRIPGADANPYFVYTAFLAAGLAGIENGLDLSDPVIGDSSTADLPDLPLDLTEAVQAFERSDIAVRALGDAVHLHLLSLAREELNIERRHVTNWDRRRCFEAV